MLAGVCHEPDNTIELQPFCRTTMRLTAMSAPSTHWGTPEMLIDHAALIML